MQFRFWRHLCSKILGKKQSKKNVALGRASPWARNHGSGRRALVEPRGPRGGHGNPSSRIPHPVPLATWLRKRWVFLIFHLSSFLYFFSFCTPDSVSERAGWAAQMSHSLSLDVMEMAEVAALLDRLAAGLATATSISGVPSSSALRARPEL